MVEQQSIIKEVKIKEKKSLQLILEELNINLLNSAILVDGKLVTDLTIEVEINSEIIILPKIKGG